jgi:hypothetical protein
MSPRGIDAWPVPDTGEVVPGVTLTAAILFAPAGQTQAAPIAPSAGMFRYLGAGGGGNTGPGGSPLHLQGGVACDGRSRYDATDGFVEYGVVPARARMRPRSPGAPTPFTSPPRARTGRWAARTRPRPYADGAP